MYCTTLLSIWQHKKALKTHPQQIVYPCLLHPKIWLFGSKARICILTYYPKANLIVLCGKKCKAVVIWWTVSPTRHTIGKITWFSLLLQQPYGKIFLVFERHFNPKTVSHIIVKFVTRWVGFKNFKQHLFGICKKSFVLR